AATVGRYRDYIGWLQGRDAMATEFFWRDRLASLEMPTRLARQACRHLQGGQPIAPEELGCHRIAALQPTDVVAVTPNGSGY
ncbi:hypothetical protein ACV34S_35025, partial [Pseudomonas aeruginosa]